MLFHEVHSAYYLATTAILQEAVKGRLTDRKLNELVRQVAFGESMLSIPERLKGEKWRLLHRDLSPAIMEEPDLPLTLLEKRWMKAVLLDPRIQLFAPDPTGLEDVEPLFTPDMLVYYDRYTDGDDYASPVYIRHFRTILQALREERNLHIRFASARRRVLELDVTPYYLEYSEKDDRFRLVAGGENRRWVINLSRITDCAVVDRDITMSLADAPKKTVTFELEDRRNTLTRVLLHFSHLEKETRRLDKNRYRVTIKYDPWDETEMVIRILSFGATLRVVEPEAFIVRLRDRIQRQIEIFPPGPMDSQAVSCGHSKERII